MKLNVVLCLLVSLACLLSASPSHAKAVSYSNFITSFLGIKSVSGTTAPLHFSGYNKGKRCSVEVSYSSAVKASDTTLSVDVSGGVNDDEDYIHGFRVSS